MAKSICETGSVPGVRKAARIKIVIIECRLYLRIIEGVRIPIFDRKNDNIGNSNTKPAPIITLRIIEKYSSIAKLLAISGEPNSAANFNVSGSITKYANRTPIKKQIVVNITIAEIYFFSFSRSAGEINFHNW